MKTICTLLLISVFYTNLNGQSMIVQLKNGKKVEFPVKDIDKITYSSSLEMTSLTDPRDGQNYKIVKIGNQTWMAENLNYNIANSWCYDNNSVNCEKFGRLYNWEVANSVCPSGWHLPSDNEFKILEMYLGMTRNQVDATNWRGTNQSAQLKSTSGWTRNGNGTNISGFNALPAGCYNYTGTFDVIGGSCYLWSSTDYGSSNAWGRELDYNQSGIYRGNIFRKIIGLSVRCVED